MSNTVLLQHFPFFRTCPARLVADLGAVMRLHQIKAGQAVFHENDTCSAIAYLLSGKIRVYMLGSDGREITLYDVQAGETCILNVACILSSKPYPAHAVVTADGEALIMPAPDFRKLVDQYSEMRDFVYSGLGDRLISMMHLVEEVAFRRLDERLKQYLTDRSDKGQLQTTHQKIANDLGTSREMISRLLEDLERKGSLSLARNQIRIVNL